MADTRVNVIVTTTGASSLSRLDKSFQGATKNARKLDSAVSQLKGALGGLAAFTGVSLGIGAIFDQIKQADKASVALKTLGADSKALKSELSSLRKELDNNVSQLELTQNAFEVMQSGFKSTAEVTQILEAATKSAQAKLIDSTVTVSALTSVLNAYGLGASQAGALSDKFFQTIADGSLTLEQYASVIGKLAPIGKSAGVSLDEINAALAKITQTGSSAGEAATGIQAILKGIIAPGTQAAKLAAELGIAFNEQALSAKGLGGVLEEVIEKTGGSAEKISTLFGSVEALQAVLALSNDGFVGFNKNLENQANAAGKVEKAYKATSDTITQALARIQNSFSGLISDSSELAGSIIPLLDGISAAINALNSPMGNFVLQIGAVTAGFILLNKAVLAFKATGLAIFLQQQIALMTTFGVKIYAVAAAQGVATKATIALRAALLTLPWVAVAAGVSYVVVKTIEARNAQAEFNRVLKEAPLDEVNAKIEELRQKLDKVKASSAGAAGGMSLFGGAAGTASLQVAQLNTQLALLEQRQAILSKTYTIGGIQYDANMVPINPPATVSDQRAAAASVYVPPSGGGGGGGGGAAAAPSDDLKALQGQIALLEKIAPLQERINAAKLVGDEQLILRLEGEKQMLELMSQGEEAIRNMNTEEGKSLQARINELEQLALRTEGEQQLLELYKQQNEARQGALQPIQDEIELLQAKINGNEEQIKQMQEIEALAKSIAGTSAVSEEDTALATQLVQQRDALKEQAEEADKLKQMYSSLASGIAGEFTSAFKSIIDGSKDVNEAFADMLQGIADQFLNMAMKILQDALTQQLMSLFSSLFAPSPTGFGGAPQLSGIPFSAGGIGYEGGGYTGDAPRSGGLDGKGGFLSVLHPQETVTDHYGDAAACNGWSVWSICGQRRGHGKWQRLPAAPTPQQQLKLPPCKLPRPTSPAASPPSASTPTASAKWTSSPAKTL